MIPSNAKASISALDQRPERPGIFVIAVFVLLASFMMLAGLLCLVAPVSFARPAGYPLSGHFVHDAEAFQLGIGATLVLSLFCRDGLVVALAGYLVGNTAHMADHPIDQALGGQHWDAWLLGAVSALTGAALIAEVRRKSRRLSS